MQHTPIMQEFHHAVAEEVRGPFSRGAPPFHESPGGGRGRGGSRDREFPRGGGVGGPGADGRRAPPPIPHDPAINPRGIEAVVKLRGLPFEATPADVTRWINDKVRSREAFLSVPVRIVLLCEFMICSGFVLHIPACAVVHMPTLADLCAGCSRGCCGGDQEWKQHWHCLCGVQTLSRC